MDVELLLQLLKSGLVLGLLYGLLAYGLNLIIAVTGVFHFAHVLAVIVAAYTFWWTFGEANLPVVLAVLASVLAGGLVGVASYLAVYRPLMKVGAGENVILVASLSVLAVGQALITLFIGSAPKALPPNDFVNAMIQIGGVPFKVWDGLVLLASLVVFLSLHVLLTRTKIGLSFRAVGDNSERALSLGIKIRSVHVWVFFVGSVVAGLSGVLLALRTPVAPSMGFQLLIYAVIILVLGGIGSMPGALIGGVFVGLVENIAYYFLPTEWAHFALYLILFLFIIIRPRGFARGRAARIA